MVSNIIHEYSGNTFKFRNFERSILSTLLLPECSISVWSIALVSQRLNIFFSVLHCLQLHFRCDFAICSTLFTSEFPLLATSNQIGTHFCSWKIYLKKGRSSQLWSGGEESVSLLSSPAALSIVMDTQRRTRSINICDICAELSFQSVSSNQLTLSTFHNVWRQVQRIQRRQ